MIINAASTLACNDMILTSSPLVLSLWPSRHNKYQISVYQPSSQYLLWKCKLVSCFKPSKVILGMRSCECIDLHKEILPYEDAWDWQKSIVEEKKVLVGKGEDCSDTIIILQHQPVYTLGTRSSVNNLKFSMENSAHEIYRTERGGEVTYHGPGQLVMYPIMNLRYHKMDLHWYLRALEEVVIRVLNSTFSMNACRMEGLTGVWVEDQKLAAVGIRVSKWITYHGFALNVTTDLAPFDQIIPCGIQDRRVGTIKGLLGKYLPSDGVMLEDDDSRLIDVTYHSLIKEFSEVFQVELRHMPSSILWKKLGACLLHSNWKKKYT